MEFVLTQEIYDQSFIFFMGACTCAIFYFMVGLTHLLFEILRYTIERSREKHKQKKEEQSNHKE